MKCELWKLMGQEHAINLKTKLCVIPVLIQSFYFFFYSWFFFFYSWFFFVVPNMTANPVLFLNIYNPTGVADGDKSRLSPFKNKFVGFCVVPNMTGFVVRDAESYKIYSLPELIYECSDCTPSTSSVYYPCSYNNGADECYLVEHA
jgi:hypothetical protein